MQSGRSSHSTDKSSKMMHFDICISSIDRNGQSDGVSDHKLTSYHSSATTRTPTSLPAQVFFDRQTTKTQVVSPDVLRCLFLDNLARWYRREQTHWHTVLTCCVKTWVVMRKTRELFYWIVRRESRSVSGETFCRFPSLNTQTESLLCPCRCFRVLVIWNHSNSGSHWQW